MPMKCHALVGCGDLIMNCNLNGVSPEICQYWDKITSQEGKLPICLDQRTRKLSIYHENIFEIAVRSFFLSLDGEVIGSNHTKKLGQKGANWVGTVHTQYLADLEKCQ
jgi:hypothetical protein